MEALYQRIISDQRLRKYGLPLLGVVCGIRALAAVNAWLSQRSLNHYTPNSTWDWKKETVVITGGNSGIGAKIVEKLAARGVKVIILDITKAKEPLPAPNVFAYQLDISDQDSVMETCSRIRIEHGHPTVLINNAALALDATILGIPMDNVQKTFAVNVFSHFQLAKEFLPHMIQKDHGHIVTVASLAAHVPRTANVTYASSKAAALAFHEGLGQELAVYYGAKRVRTTVVLPSFIRTPMIQHLVAHGLKAPMVEPDLVADAVVRQLYSGNSGHLVVPSSYSLATGIRGWPHWLHQKILMGVSESSKDATVSAMNAAGEKTGAV
ncbi:hypothetical protein PV08_10318 [Exophiala spinifera]|uniref:Short-chain dehydrogenase/reductase 3 n=1 Tax=Exophiala spinifera TaxID=91928 RepID=A0A0D2BI62_9EURO|nr:uncharacterized protein PV08_10318 [Exophiala spinifera]KIW11019.1 hypothetical protein PV08_10318 [Exophiala spinifera]